jgi:tetratricopeptide (TPR) repeat protein
MRSLFFAVLLSTMALSACAQVKADPAAVSSTVVAAGELAQAPMIIDTDESLDEMQARAAEALGATAPSKLPPNELSRETLYKFLLAEVAAQRGNLRLAARAYLEIAQATRDPRIARRATELASSGRFNDLALDAAGLWVDIEPASSPARQSLVNALVGGNRLTEAKPYLKKLLSGDPARVGATFMQITGLLSRHQDKSAALALTRDLAAPYPAVPEAHFAVAQMAAAAGKFDVAGAALKQCLKLRPSFEPAALLNAQTLARESNAKAIEFLAAWVAANPQAREARLIYARLLVADKRTEEARAEFGKLEQESPNNPELVVTIGLLSLQLNDLDTAQERFKRAIDLNYRDPDTLRFYLGQIAEERKRVDEALGWYAQVEEGEQQVSAAARYAAILARQNKLSEARLYLKSITVRTPQQRVQLVQAEAQVLRDAKAYREAFDVLGAALEREPDNADLLYDSAMAAERLDDLGEVESRLKRLIALKPDHAQAFNALGYTFADRNLRLPEARDYIQKALDLAPEDPFILDSMGWVHFRMGNPDKGLDYLQRAYARRPDPEIAAHIGEVLWALGRRKEAEKTWREALQANPASEELQAVMRKFLN